MSWPGYSRFVKVFRKVNRILHVVTALQFPNHFESPTLIKKALLNLNSKSTQKCSPSINKRPSNTKSVIWTILICNKLLVASASFSSDLTDSLLRVAYSQSELDWLPGTGLQSLEKRIKAMAVSWKCRNVNDSFRPNNGFVVQTLSLSASVELVVIKTHHSSVDDSSVTSCTIHAFVQLANKRTDRKAFDIEFSAINIQTFKRHPEYASLIDIRYLLKCCQTSSKCLRWAVSNWLNLIQMLYCFLCNYFAGLKIFLKRQSDRKD